MLRAAGDTGVRSVVAGSNVTVDNTDPANPIISSTGGGGGSASGPSGAIQISNGSGGFTNDSGLIYSSKNLIVEGEITNVDNLGNPKNIVSELDGITTSIGFIDTTLTSGGVLFMDNTYIIDDQANFAYNITKKALTVGGAFTSGGDVTGKKYTGDGLDISNGIQGGILLGADNNAKTRTSNTNKNVSIAAPHYSSSGTCSVINLQSTSSQTVLNIGGSESGNYAVTEINLLVGGNTTTNVGTRGLRVDTGGVQSDFKHFFAGGTNALAPINIPALSSDPSTLINGDTWNLSGRPKFRSATSVESIAFLSDIGGGGGSGEALTKSINQTSHGFAVGDVLYHNGSFYAKAKADAESTAEVIGIVTTVTDSNNFILTAYGFCSGLSSLTAGAVYFLSPSTAGAITTTQPSTVGHVSKPLFVATTTTTGYFINYRGISITNTASYPTGTYTPTLTNVANISASTAYECTYQRTGNFVSVFGEFDIDPTLTATATELGISLPVASALTNSYQLGGNASSGTVAGMSARITADPTNDRAAVKFMSSDITNSTMSFQFSYRVI